MRRQLYSHDVMRRPLYLLRKRPSKVARFWLVHHYVLTRSANVVVRALCCLQPAVANERRVELMVRGGVARERVVVELQAQLGLHHWEGRRVHNIHDISADCVRLMSGLVGEEREIPNVRRAQSSPVRTVEAAGHADD